MQVQQASLAFGPVSGSGPQVQSTTVSFTSPVTQAVAILTGFTAEYSGNNDHHLGQLDVRVVVPAGGITGATVAVQVTYGLRDSDTNFDDEYDGQV
jgi:hypothetical protein